MTAIGNVFEIRAWPKQIGADYLIARTDRAAERAPRRIDIARAEVLPDLDRGRHAEPDDIAEVVLFLASDAARWVNGQAIAALGRSLDLSLVAEGVETKEQLAFLRTRGCDSYQGYLFAKPLTSGEMSASSRVVVVSTASVTSPL